MNDPDTYRQQFEDTIKSLNETQKESVLSEAKTLQILAGPGSGKTRVLTCRAAHFVLNKSMRPQQVIVVTFTNKAANEMKKRLVSMIGEKNTDNLVIGTFHSICARLLRYNAAIVDLKSNFTIIDRDASELIVKKLQKDDKLDIDHFTRDKQKPGVIWSIISKAKSEGITAPEYQELHRNDFSRRNIAVVYTAYEEELKNNNLIDFDNILVKACELFRKKKNVLAHIKAILVDEYQDTNIVQYDLIKLITQNQFTDKSVTIAGDPDQSIFGFRSAEPKNFHKMQDDYLDTETINVEQNYRSTGIILDAALNVIKQDSTRIQKSLYTNNPTGIPISIIPTMNEDDQADFVAKEIKKIVKYSKGLVTYRDFAVLMRMSFISRQFESAFRRNRIPFTIIGGVGFFNRIEVKDILGYLKFAYNPYDFSSYARIINVPKRGIGDVTLNKIALFHEQHPGSSMLESLNQISHGQGAFNNTIRQKLRGLTSIIGDVKAMIDGKVGIPDILGFIVDATHYQDYLEDKYFSDHEARWNNIGELISLAKENHAAGDDDPIYSQTQTQTRTQNQSQTETNENTEIDPNDSDVVEVEVVGEDDDEEETIEDFTVGSQEPVDFDVDQQENDSSQEEDVQLGSSNEVKEEDMDEFDIPPLEKDPVVDFLEYCSLSGNEKEQNEAEGGKVTVSTMHTSKGLEWPCVFIATCCDGVIPMLRDPDVSEERRLLYVAMTRSQFLLYCMYPEERNNWGELEVTKRTRFFNGMNKKLYRSSPPEWDNDTRAMMAATLGKPAPPDDDTLVTKKKTSQKSSNFSTQYTDSPSEGFSSQTQPKYQTQPTPSTSKFPGGFVSAASLVSTQPSKPTKSKSMRTPPIVKIEAKRARVKRPTPID